MENARTFKKMMLSIFFRKKKAEFNGHAFVGLYVKELQFVGENKESERYEAEKRNTTFKQSIIVHKAGRWNAKYERRLISEAAIVFQYF